VDAALSLDHVVVAVSDWGRSNAFYRDVLGEEGPVPRRGARGAGRASTSRDPDGSLLELISYE